MRRLLTWAPALIVSVFMIGMAFGQNVRTDYDHHTDFGNFHTYSWAKVQTTDPLWEPRIKDAVNHALESKGWHEVQSGGEVMLTAVGSARNQQEYQTFYDGMGGWGWGNGFGETTTNVVNQPVGTLILDMYNAQNKQLVWRGVASNTLSSKTEKNVHELDQAVDKMLKNFPPNEKK